MHTKHVNTYFEVNNPLYYMREKPCCQRTVCPTPRIIKCSEKQGTRSGKQGAVEN
jgi:hypothetical protein